MNRKFLCLFFVVLSLNVWGREVPLEKVSVTGAVFTLNLSHPPLGNAYQDPSGVIWGDLVIENNRVVQTDASSAEAYCESIGARLPSLEEYKNLAKYLGYGSRGGYSPDTQDGSDMILLGLPFHWYWTSTPYWFSSKKFQNIFWGDSGSTSSGVRRSKGGAIHCVIKA